MSKIFPLLPLPSRKTVALSDYSIEKRINKAKTSVSPLMIFKHVALSSIAVMTYWVIIQSASSCVVVISWRSVLILRCTCTGHSVWDVIISFFSQGALVRTLSKSSANNFMSCFFNSVEWRVISFGGSGVDKDRLWERRTLPMRSWPVIHLIL